MFSRPDRILEGPGDRGSLNEAVISIEIEGEAKAYPLGILTYHEIVNDIIGGTPACN